MQCLDPGRKPKLRRLPFRLSICKVLSVADLPTEQGFFFIGRTEEEISLVCETAHVPERVTAREDGWRCFRVEGSLDFSLTGILSGISGVLAENAIGIFAVSTYNTDYILVRGENFEQAMGVLEQAGYETSGADREKGDEP